MNRTSNKKQAGWIVGAIASASLALGCGGPQGTDRVGPLESPSVDNEGIGELTRPLMVPTGTHCKFASVPITAPSSIAKGELVIEVPTTETLVLSKHALNGNLLLNGFEKVCDVYSADNTSTTGVISASKIFAIRIDAATGATGTTVVLDFANGIFGTAVSGTAGAGSGVKVGASLAPTNLKVRTGAAADKLAFGLASSVKYGDFDGKSPADIVFTNTPALTINTGAGADTVDGSGPIAIFATGATAFTTALTVYGAKGADNITGGAQADSLYGGEDNDIVKGGGGNDKIWGGKGDDTLHGQMDDDTVVGEEGSDTINEGSDGIDNGSDRLYGWLNNDQDGDGIADTQEATALPEIVSTSGTAFNAEDSEDSDTLTYAGRSNAVVVSPGTTTAPVGGRSTSSGTPDPYNCAANADCFINTATTSELAADANDGESGEKDIVRGDFDVIVGTDKDDTFYSGPGDEEFLGGKGNDIFYATRVASGGADGADIFKGGDDTDTVSYRARTTAVCVSLAAAASVAADKNDGTPANIADCELTATVTSGTLTVTVAMPTTGSEGDDAQSDVEVLEGGGAGDVLVGNAKNNVLRGADGNDTLVGLAGDDVLDEAFGGSAASFSTDNTSNGSDALYGGAGTDTVTYASDCVGCFGSGGSTKARTTSICATINSVNDSADPSWKSSGACTGLNVDTTTFAISFTPTTELDTIRMDVENLTGGTGLDLLTGNDKDNVLDGFGLPGTIPPAPSAQSDLVACGLGEGDTAYKASDVGYDNKRQPNGQQDMNSCEL